MEAKFWELFQKIELFGNRQLKANKKKKIEKAKDLNIKILEEKRVV